MGAGPAGTVAALRLARVGARVLLLEKQALGRHKPCGGGLTPRAWEHLEVPVDELVLSRTRWAELRHGPVRKVRVDLGLRPVLMVRRCDFDRRLAEEAAAAGVDLHDREPATAVAQVPGGVTVTTDRGRYAASALLLATGAEGPLRAQLGLRPPSRVMAVGLEVEAPAAAPRLDPHTFVFDYDVPDGYAWAFPKGDLWNVGVLSTRPGVGPRLRGLLARFVASAGIRFGGAADPVARAGGRRIPFHGGRPTLCAGRALLVGDAAGLADPFFGEGIAQALISGRLAAGAVQRLLAGAGQGLEEYPALVRRALGGHLARMRWMGRAVYAAPELAVRMMAFPPPRVIARALATEPFARPG